MTGSPMQQANRRLVRRLLYVAVAMFGFGFALVPLYDVFCDITGLNGKTGTVQAGALDNTVDESRWVTVEFLANVNRDLPWEFRPGTTRMRVRPGAINTAYYFARNGSGEEIVGQAIPSVAPGAAALHFKKTECFCFTRQPLGPGEEKEMPLRFVVDRDLPKEISTLTLSYTFFDARRTAVD